MPAYLCEVPDCPKRARNGRMCWGHYQRKRRHGDPLLGNASSRGIFADRIVRETPELQKAYWAGFFDGEGSVGIYVNNARKCFTYKCSANQKKPHTKVLKEIAEAYGGSITEVKSGSMECVQLSGMRAYEFLEDILPYSQIKRGQMELFLGTISRIRMGLEVDVRKVVEEMASMKRVGSVPNLPV